MTAGTHEARLLSDAASLPASGFGSTSSSPEPMDNGVRSSNSALMCQRGRLLSAASTPAAPAGCRTDPGRVGIDMSLRLGSGFLLLIVPPGNGSLFLPVEMDAPH